MKKGNYGNALAELLCIFEVDSIIFLYIVSMDQGKSATDRKRLT